MDAHAYGLKGALDLSHPVARQLGVADRISDRARWLAVHVLPIEQDIRRWIMRLIGAASVDVDDIIQETYATLSALASTDHILCPRSYTFQTARSVLLAQFRGAKVVWLHRVSDAGMTDLPDNLPSPETIAGDRLALARLMDLVDRLPPRQQEAFRLLKIEGLSQREAASRMGIAQSTLEKHVARAILALADRTGRGGADHSGAEQGVEEPVPALGQIRRP